MKAPKNSPWLPAVYDDHDTMAIKALAVGKASETQQRQALDWIVNRLCGTYDLSFRPDSERETAFAEGKRFIGLQLVKQIKLVMPTKK